MIWSAKSRLQGGAAITNTGTRSMPPWVGTETTRNSPGGKFVNRVTPPMMAARIYARAGVLVRLKREDAESRNRTAR